MVWASLQALGDVVEHPAGFFFPEKMTSLAIFDMYLNICDVFGQCLVNVWQYLVNVCPAGECPGLYVP